MKKLVYTALLAYLSLCLAEAQTLLKDFENNHVTTSSISFTSDGRYFLVSGYAKAFNVDAGRIDFRTIEKDTETQGDFSVRIVASPDNSTFLFTKAGRIEVWDLKGRKKIRDVRDTRLIENAVCYSRDGRSILYMRKNGEMVVLNSQTLSETYCEKVTDATPSSLGAASDGKKVIIGTKESQLVLFDLVTHSVNPVKIPERGIQHLDISPAGDYVAGSTTTGKIWLGKYPSLETIMSWQAHPDGYTGISFHPSGRFLASGGKDKKVCIWSIPACSLVSEWPAHKYAVVSVAFSPDGQKLVSGGLNDSFVRGGDDTKLWSFNTPATGVPQVSGQGKALAQANTVTQPQTNDATYGGRLALVIGNGNYQSAILANPENDARAMKEVLSQCGFDVIEYENLGQSRMKQAMDDFGERLKKYDVGLFFYAGHGMQSKGYNYLIPVDAELRSEEQVEYDCVQADRILALMEASGSKVNIIILDACRNNPFERSWTRSATGKGLAFMNAPEGTLIAYATAPGSTASDGSGRNGLYTSAILETIRVPDISILQMFQNVRSIVSQQSNRQQIPWESTSLVGDFYFNKTK